MQPAEIMAYVLVLLYIMAPIEAIQNALGSIVQADVAIKRVEGYGLSLNEQKVTEDYDEKPLAESFYKHSKIKFVDVLYSYYSVTNAKCFTLGSISLTFYSNEIVFLVGGNGSGKSTLVKVLTGLYMPDRGAIYVDDTLIGAQNIGMYRQLFSAVFQDFWLFETLFGLKGEVDLDSDAKRWLRLLRLDNKVNVKNGTLSTIDLSRGERKRLALLTALLEDRSFLIFDEWAADQDPIYKQVFYHEILPSLKKLGKTVLVITHDDRYWHLADRLIKLDSGRIFEKKSLGREKGEPSCKAPIKRVS